MKTQEDTSFSLDMAEPSIEALAAAIGPDTLVNFMRIMGKADAAITARKMKEPRPAQTYIMLDEQTGYYKIGKSIKPPARERTLQAERPSIVMLAYCGLDIEAKLHALLSANRLRGEWFSLSKWQVADIISQYNFTIINA